MPDDVAGPLAAPDPPGHVQAPAIWPHLQPFLPLLRHWAWWPPTQGLGLELTFDDDQTTLCLAFTEEHVDVSVRCFRVSPERAVLVWLLRGPDTGGWRAAAEADPADPTLLTVSLHRSSPATRQPHLAALVWAARLDSQRWRRTFLRS